jgi:hypothetical protein
MGMRVGGRRRGSCWSQWGENWGRRGGAGQGRGGGEKSGAGASERGEEWRAPASATMQCVSSDRTDGRRCSIWAVKREERRPLKTCKGLGMEGD